MEKAVKFIPHKKTKRRGAFHNFSRLGEKIISLIPHWIKRPFRILDQRVDGAASFFIKHYGKSRFMLAMSKKAQYLGLEQLWERGPKAFIYFFLFYLIRDTIIYIIIPIIFATLTS